MIKNYLITAWRNIRKSKGFSLINIAGLAVGLAVCLLILLYVRDELSYDSYHTYADRICRIQRSWYDADGSIGDGFATLAPSFVPLLKNEFKEIEEIARMFGIDNTVLKAGDIAFTEERLFFAEPEIFKILTIPLIRGDAETALNDAGAIVLSRSMAKKYFGDEDPMGKTITTDNRLLFQVTGVMEDVPPNSHLHFDFLASYLTLKGLNGSGDDDYFHGTRNFSDNVTAVYARLAKGVKGSDMEAKIPAFLDRHFPARKDDQGRLVKVSSLVFLRFMPVNDIHLHSHTRKEFEFNSDIRNVTLFTIIALFILAIACINFMNLSTARASKRAKEVGLRKVVGATRRTLAVQFLGESFLVTLIAFVLALALAVIALSSFSQFTGHHLSLSQAFIPKNILVLAAGFLVTGLVAGLYPSLYVASYRPATILKGELTRGTGGAVLRRALIVFQFAISIALIFCVSVISNQIRFIQNADLGFDRENILLIPADREIIHHWPDVKNALLQESRILAATLSKRAPSGRLLDSPGFQAEVYGKQVRNAFEMPHNRVEHDFFKTYGMKIIAGRDFSIEYPTDEQEAFILNETAVRQLGFKSPQDAVGAVFETFAPDKKGRVIGVVRDFNYESLHQTIVPIVTYIAPNQANTLSLRIAAGSLSKVEKHVKGLLDRFRPAGSLDYDFLNDRLAALYRNEERTMNMFSAFSMLAILIGCLGLLGLATYSAEQRTKEIGVRKVLGASVSNIILLLSREFTKWVIAANIIAWPLAYLGMRRWLQNFAYRTPIGFEPFLLSAVLAFCIALITVSYQSIKSALADPVKSLRYE
jgi:putative ABC transport system permease protein